MTVDDLLAALGEENARDAVRPYWANSMALLPEGGVPFLADEAVRNNLIACSFGGETVARALPVARRVAADSVLAQLAWHAAWRLFDCPEAGHFRTWPSLRRVLGDDAGIFYLLVAVSCAPRVRAFHARIGVPAGITRETLLESNAYCLAYMDEHGGHPGLPRRWMAWIRNYTNSLYFRVGRLEYWHRPNPGGPVVFRHRSNGKTLALVPDGIRFDGDGFVGGRAGEFDTEQGWMSALTIGANSAIGNPILPVGRALREPVTLCFDDWEQVLGTGDPVLQMHIPHGGGMTPEACETSMRRAAAFFARQFPDQPPRAFVCGSWIFNPDLDQILGPESNLPRYHRELYLYPIWSSGRDGLQFVFYDDNVDLATARRDTSLRRALLDHLAAGKLLRNGGMLFLVDEIDRYGTQWYRSQWSEEELQSLG